jgi:hypothetical protein
MQMPQQQPMVKEPEVQKCDASEYYRKLQALTDLQRKPQTDGTPAGLKPITYTYQPEIFELANNTKLKKQVQAYVRSKQKSPSKKPTK